MTRRHNFSTWLRYHSFWRCLVSFVKFSYGPSFLLMLPLVLELWKFSFTRNWPEIRKSEIPPSEFCQTSGDWEELPNIRNTKFGAKVSNKMLLNAAKCQCCSVYHLWVITGKPTGGLQLHPYPAPTRLGLMENLKKKMNSTKHNYKNTQNHKNSKKLKII